MGLSEQRQEKLKQKRIRFGNTHLGAQQRSGSAGTTDYPYIAYNECGAAMLLELCSILSVIAGLGLMYALSGSRNSSLSDYLLYAGGILLVNRGFAVAAKLVNNAQVRKRIVNDTDYAYEFAYKYPEQAHICRELNPAYAANPDAVPADEIREKLTREKKDFEPKRKIICAAGLGFLALALIAMIVFCVWAYRETS